MNSEISFKQTTLEDLPQIENLKPEGWANILPAFKFYLNYNLAFPYCIIKKNTIIGTCVYIIHEDSAWLAHIIISPIERNKGYGFYSTRFIIDQIPQEIIRINLIATDLGRPMYQKLGFKDEEKYLFYHMNTSSAPYIKNQYIFSYESKYLTEIFEIDQFVSGEKRSNLLFNYIEDCLLYIENLKLKGVYFPSLGEGLIISIENQAGIELLKYKMQTQKQIVIPELNIAGNQFFDSISLPHIRSAYRMCLGKTYNRNPQYLFSRIGGNLG